MSSLIPEQRKEFSDQCFLIEKAQEIYDYHKTNKSDSVTIREHTDYGGALVRQLGAVPGGKLTGYTTNFQYINEITLLKDIRNFFEQTPAESAQLASFANILITNREIKGPGVHKHNVFGRSTANNTSLGELSLLKTTGERLGAGIQNIDITYEGIDSATKKVILVNAKFIFEDIRTMLEMPYVELFKIQTTDNMEFGTSSDPAKTARTVDFEIGYNARDHKIGSERKSLSEKLGLPALVLNLQTHLVKYTFDLKQDGSIVVDAQYRGHIVDVFSGPASNILALAKADWVKIREQVSEITANAAKTEREVTARLEAKGIATLAKKFIDMASKQFIPGPYLLSEARYDFNTGDNVHHWNPEGEIPTDPDMNSGKHTSLRDALRTLVGQNRADSDSALGSVWKRAIERHINLIYTDSLGLNQYNIGAHQGNHDDRYAIISAVQLARRAMSDAKEKSGSETEITLLTKVIRKIRDEKRSLRRAIFSDMPAGVSSRSATPHFLSWHEANRQRNMDAVGQFLFGTMAAGSTVAESEAELEEAKAETNKSMQEATRQQVLAAGRQKFIALQEIVNILIDPNKNDMHTAYVFSEKAQDFRLKVAEERHAEATTIIDEMTPEKFLAVPDAFKDTASEADVNAAMDDRKYQVIPYIFLGRLVESILMLPTTRVENSSDLAPKPNVYDLMVDSSGNQFTVDFGFLSYKGPYSGKQLDDFPLYYLPISLKKINDFFAREIIAKEKDYFAFENFLTSLIRNFLTSMFSICVSESNKTAIMAPKVQTAIGHKRVPNSRFQGIQYFIYGFKNVAKDIGNTIQTFGKYSENLDNNIYHFFFAGRNRGIARSIKLTDVADETTKTAVYFRNRASARSNTTGQADAEGGSRLAPVVFQASIETLGFPLYNMGQMVYVDLRPYITEDSLAQRIFKAAGYYSITKVSHSFSAEKFSSTIQAILHYSKGDAEAAASSGTALVNTSTPSTSDTELAKSRAETETLSAQIKWLEEWAKSAGTSQGGETRVGGGALRLPVSPGALSNMKEFPPGDWQTATPETPAEE